MKESKFQKQVKKQLESQAAFIVNVHGHMMQKAGLPDLFIIHKDWKGFLELKVEKGQASALQRITAAKIELRGMPVYVLRCRDICGDGVSEPYYKYTLEYFNGQAIKAGTFYNLSELLRILKGLNKLKLSCEYLLNREQPTGDAETCQNQCTDYTRDKCRERWNLENRNESI